MQLHTAVSSSPEPTWLHMMSLQDACSTARDVSVIRLPKVRSLAKALWKHSSSDLLDRSGSARWCACFSHSGGMIGPRLQATGCVGCAVGRGPQRENAWTPFLASFGVSEWAVGPWAPCRQALVVAPRPPRRCAYLSECGHAMWDITKLIVGASEFVSRFRAVGPRVESAWRCG